MIGLSNANGVKGLAVTILDQTSTRYRRIDVLAGGSAATRTGDDGPADVCGAFLAALTGIRPTHGQARLHVRVSPDEQFFGHNSKLLARLSAAASATVDGVSKFDPDSNTSPTNEWQGGLRDLVRWSNETPPDDGDHYFCTLEGVIAELQIDLDILVSRTPDGSRNGEPVDVVLVAVGTVQRPEWAAYVATPCAPTAEFIPGGPKALQELERKLDPRIEDMVLFAGCGEPEVAMRLVKIGPISADDALEWNASPEPSSPFDVPLQRPPLAIRQQQMPRPSRVDTYRSSPTAKLRDVSAIPAGRSEWDSRLAGRTGRVIVDRRGNQVRFIGLDPETGALLVSHPGPSPAVQDSVGNPAGKGHSGEATCNGWKQLTNPSDERLHDIAPPYEGDVR